MSLFSALEEISKRVAIHPASYASRLRNGENSLRALRGGIMFLASNLSAATALILAFSG